MLKIRVDEATRERDGSYGVCHTSNGDIEGGDSPMAKFHKTLPHDSLGQVKLNLIIHLDREL